MTKEQVMTIAKKLAKQIAPKFGLAPDELAQIATGVAYQESRFNPSAENNTSSARGLMQVLINTQRETEKKYAKVPFAPAKYKSSYFPNAPIGKDRMFNPEYNMLIGMSYLAYQLRRYGSKEKGIHAYNQGSYPGKWQNDGAMYSDSVQNYLTEKFPIEDFRDKNIVSKIVDKIKQKSTENDDGDKFVLNVNGAFY